MRKIILTLGALCAAGTISAQSYPKQPDPKIVDYRPYVKPEKTIANEIKANNTSNDETEIKTEVRREELAKSERKEKDERLTDGTVTRKE